MFRTARLWFALSFVVYCEIVGQGSAALAGPDELPALAAHAAENLARFLKARNKDATSVNVHPIPTLKSNLSNAIAQHFAEALKTRKVRLADKVDFALDIQPKLSHRDDFATAANDDDDQIEAISIEVHIVDRRGEKMVDQDFGGRIEGLAEIQGLLGLSGDGVKQSNATTSGRSKIQASATGKYAIEIVVNNTPREARVEDGLAYVDLSLDEEYAVRIHNQSGFESAVALRVDGLSVFHFSEMRTKDAARQGEPQYRWYILKPGTNSFDIKGWHVNNAKSKAFKVGLREDSLAAKAGVTAEIGVIHAQFFSSWEPNARLASIPPNEPARKDRGKEAAGSGPPQYSVAAETMTCRDGIATEFLIRHRVYRSEVVQIGTTFGSDVITGTTGVARVIGIPRDSIAVRYRMPK